MMMIILMYVCAVSYIMKPFTCQTNKSVLIRPMPGSLAGKSLSFLTFTLNTTGSVTMKAYPGPLSSSPLYAL